jgi:hypothetical protein
VVAVLASGSRHRAPPSVSVTASAIQIEALFEEALPVSFVGDQVVAVSSAVIRIRL